MDPSHPLVLQRATLNGYLIAAELAFTQMAWDVRPVAWRSRRRLRGWHGRHHGARAVIVCNGPSLLKSDLGLLDGVFTFGLNKINLLFGQSAFRPSCIVSVNPYVLEQNADFFNETSIPLFLDSAATRHVRERPNVVYLNSVGHRRFAKDCTMGVYQGHTVTFVALQLAFHFGFREVALIGCDHRFSTTGPANMTVVSGSRDPDHFSADYFAGGAVWQLPDLFESEVVFRMARNMFEAHDRRIVNATVGGHLEVFERMSLEAFVRG